ncbi:MAG: hypothetical protein WCJ81_00350 [bacterium]
MKKTLIVTISNFEELEKARILAESLIGVGIDWKNMSGAFGDGGSTFETNIADSISICLEDKSCTATKAAEMQKNEQLLSLKIDIENAESYVKWLKDS